jgi:hypothetical protein
MTAQDNQVQIESGTFIIEYALVTATGAAKPVQAYAGSFTTENYGVVVLSADGRELVAARDRAERRMTFTGTLPKLGGLTIVFQRDI